MAEHPDVALVRRGYAAFAAGDMTTLSELLAEDARQYQPGSGAISGEYRGRDGILAFYARLASETNGTLGLCSRARTPMGRDGSSPRSRRPQNAVTVGWTPARRSCS